MSYPIYHLSVPVCVLVSFDRTLFKTDEEMAELISDTGYAFDIFNIYNRNVYPRTLKSLLLKKFH